MFSRSDNIPVMETLEPRLMMSADEPFVSAAVNRLPVMGAITINGAARISGISADDYQSTMAAAGKLTLWNNTGTVWGRIDYAGDTDMFVVTATKSGTMAVDQNAIALWNPVRGNLYAYDAQGNLLAHDDAANGSTQVTFAVQAGQKYYLKASALNKTLGWYSLKAAVTEIPPPAPLDDGSDGDDATETPEDTYIPGTTITTRIVTTAGGLQLVVLGTNAADLLTLSQFGGGMTLTTATGTRTIGGNFASTLLYGFGGDDSIRVDYTVTQPTFMYGGDGADMLYATGLGVETAYAGAGDDLIVSIGAGADLIYGEAGTDSFWADYADQLLDASTAETAATNVHRVAGFLQNTAAGVPLEIRSQNLADPEADYAYRSFFTRKLFTDGPEYNDVAQGYLGDCYFLASLASLAQSDPNVIRQMIAPLGDGTYAVRFFRGNTPVYVRVDSDLPASGSGPVYARLTPDGELWVALAEKAYAEFRYSDNAYESLNGGWMSTSSREITGAACGDRSTSGSGATLAQYLTTELNAGHALTAATVGSPSGPVVGQHAYMVKGVETVSGTTYVTVYNPWGYDGRAADTNGSDGLIKLTMAQFQANFFLVSYCLA